MKGIKHLRVILYLLVFFFLSFFVPFAAKANSLALPTGDNNTRSMVADITHGYVYVGTNTSPAKIVKIRTSDFSVVDTLTLDVNGVMSAAIDTTNSFAYFGNNASPAQVVKVDLSTFTEVGKIALGSGENTVKRMAIDTTNGFLYAGTYSSPGKLAKINLSTFTEVNVISLSVDDVNAIAIDTTNGFLYLGFDTEPGQIIKVNLSTFAVVGTINTLTNDERYFTSAVIDVSGGYLYFGTTGITPGEIIKVNLSTFAVAGKLIVNTATSSYLASATTDPIRGYAYFGIYNSDTAGADMISLNLSTFTIASTTHLIDSFMPLKAAAIDNINGYAYFSADVVPGIIYKTSLLGDFTPPIGSITLGGGSTYWTANTAPGITLTTDDASQYQLCLNSATVNNNCTSVARSWTSYTATPTAYDFSSQGTKTLYVQFKDAFGNISATYSDDITIDTIAPTVGTINIPSSDVYQNLSSYTWQWSTGSDSGSGLHDTMPYHFYTYTDSGCSTGMTDQGTSASTSMTVSSGLTNGNSYWSKVAYMDKAGNIATSSCSAYKVVIDTVPPIIMVVNPNSSPAKSKTITATTNEGGLTMSNTTGSVCDGGLIFVPYADQTFSANSNNGTKVCYKAVDLAGNTSYSLSNAINGIVNKSSGVRTCLKFDYTDWSECINGLQTRKVSSSTSQICTNPSINILPLSQSCVLNSTTTIAVSTSTHATTSQILPPSFVTPVQTSTSTLTQIKTISLPVAILKLLTLSQIIPFGISGNNYFNFETQITNFIFSYSLDPISETLNNVPVLKNYLLSSGLVKIQKFAILTRNPLPLPQQSDIPGLFSISNDNKVLLTYLTNDSEGNLSQLVHVASGTPIIISLIPTTGNDVFGNWSNGKQTQFISDGKIFTAKVIMTKAGEYIFKTSASPLPLIIEVIPTFNTDQTNQKNASWYSKIWDWFNI